MNWACLLASWFSKRHVSPVFPAPSLLTALGLALLEPTRPYWWAGLLTDYTFFGLVITAPALLAEVWHTSRFTRMQLVRAEDPPRRFELSLHRGGHFWLRATFEPPTPCNPRGGRINSYGAVGHRRAEPDGRLRLWGYGEQRELTLERTEDGYLSREEHYPEAAEFPYDSLAGVRFRSAN